MKFDFVDLFAVISAFIGAGIATVEIISIWKKKKELREAEKRRKMEVEVMNSLDKTGYSSIKNATFWLEHERQRNQGDHYEDESVYLNRAKTIREKTPLFSYINTNYSLS